jgi:hypothetical protein
VPKDLRHGLQGDLTEDPIAESLAQRVNLGGFSNQMTEAEARKKGVSVPKSFKLQSKDKTELVTLGNPQPVAPKPFAAQPSSQEKKPLTKPAHSTTAAKAPLSGGLKGDLSDDPIG